MICPCFQGRTSLKSHWQNSSNHLLNSSCCKNCCELLIASLGRLILRLAGVRRSCAKRNYFSLNYRSSKAYLEVSLGSPGVTSAAYWPSRVLIFFSCGKCNRKLANHDFYFFFFPPSFLVIPLTLINIANCFNSRWSLRTCLIWPESWRTICQAFLCILEENNSVRFREARLEVHGIPPFPCHEEG